MPDRKISELPTGTPVDNDWIPFVDISEGITKKATKEELEGEQGPAGQAATVNVGTTTTSAPGGDANVTNSGTENAAVLDFTIPRGVAGPVGLNWRGEYSNTTAYAVNDGVRYQGSSYICESPTTGNLPTDTNFWGVLAEAGQDNEGGGSGDVVGPSSATNNAVPRYDGTTGKLIQGSDVTILDNGNVGIGTATPETALHVSTSGNSLATIQTTNTGDGAIEIRNAQGSTYFGIDGGENFGIGDGPDLNGINQMFTVDMDNGNVGIGTANPQVKLDVNGGLTSTGVIANLLTDSVFNEIGGKIGVTMGRSFDSPNRSIEFGYGSNSQFGRDPFFYVSPMGTERFRITHDGNFGIGTANPNAKLEVDGDIRLQTDTFVDPATIPNDRALFNCWAETGGGFRRNLDIAMNSGVGGGVGGSNIRLWTNPSSASTPEERMRIDRNGNVGIGTTSPNANARLDVSGNTRTSGVINAGTGMRTTGGADLVSGNGVSMYYHTGNYGVVEAGTWGTTTRNMVINPAGGNVFIGKTSGNSRFGISGLPTSSAGLSSGDIWNNNGVLNIVS